MSVLLNPLWWWLGCLVVFVLLAWLAPFEDDDLDPDYHHTVHPAAVDVMNQALHELGLRNPHGDDRA